jgi:hypothetical protein
MPKSFQESVIGDTTLLLARCLLFSFFMPMSDESVFDDILTEAHSQKERDFHPPTPMKIGLRRYWFS